MLLIDEFNVDEDTANRMGMFTKYNDPNWAVGRCYVDTLEAWVAVLSQQEVQAIYEKGYFLLSPLFLVQYTAFNYYFALDGSYLHSDNCSNDVALLEKCNSTP